MTLYFLVQDALQKMQFFSVYSSIDHDLFSKIRRSPENTFCFNIFINSSWYISQSKTPSRKCISFRRCPKMATLNSGFHLRRRWKFPFDDATKQNCFGRKIRLKVLEAKNPTHRQFLRRNEVTTQNSLLVIYTDNSFWRYKNYKQTIIFWTAKSYRR